MADKKQVPPAESFSDFESELRSHIDNTAMLQEIHKAMKAMLSGDGVTEHDVRAMLQEQYDRGDLRNESFQLVQNMIDRIVSDHTATATDILLPAVGNSFSSTMVIPEMVQDQNAADRILQVGSVLRDRFMLTEEVSGGSMGTVYKALDRRLAEADAENHWVAIKVLTAKLSRNADALRALQQEAVKTRCLAHPNIVTFIDLDRDDQLYFMVMEWLEGRPLAEVLEDANTVIDLDTAFDIIRQIAEALHYAHQRGVVHADVKPGNIMITPSGQAKLFDFGIARIRQTQNATHQNFDPGVLKAATPAYSSMQVLTGEDPVATDDVFSLGCLAYRLIAGFRAFGPRNAAEAAEAGMEPQRLDSLGKAQWQALRKALAFSRVARFATPVEFVEALAGTKGVSATVKVPAIAALATVKAPGAATSAAVEAAAAPASAKVEAPLPPVSAMVDAPAPPASATVEAQKSASVATVMESATVGVAPVTTPEPAVSLPVMTPAISVDEIRVDQFDSETSKPWGFVVFMLIIAVAAAIVFQDDLLQLYRQVSKVPAAMVTEELELPAEVLPNEQAEPLTDESPESAELESPAETAAETVIAEDSEKVGAASEAVQAATGEIPDSTDGSETSLLTEDDRGVSEASAEPDIDVAERSNADRTVEPILEPIIDFSTLPPANMIVSLAAPGEVPGVSTLILREDTHPIIVDFVRKTNLAETLTVRLAETSYDGQASPMENGQYMISNHGAIHFPARQPHARLTIAMTSDPLRESDRQVTLTVLDVDYAGGEFASIHLTLQDDDQRAFEESAPVNTITFAASQVSARERDAVVQIDIIRFKPDDTAMDVAYEVRDVTATEGEDYIAPGSRMISFAPHQRYARILIPLVRDSAIEPDEAFVLDLVGLGPDTEGNTYRRIAVMIRDDN